MVDCIGGRAGAPPNVVGDRGWDPKDMALGDWALPKVEGAGAPNIGAACAGLKVLRAAGVGAEPSISNRLVPGALGAATGAAATGDWTGAVWKSSKSSSKSIVSKCNAEHR